MFGSFLQTLITAVVWIVANVVYLDMKRKGLRGFTRFAAFWAGTPTTWITFFAVREGTQPTFDFGVDYDGLLEQIRRDKALRGGPEEVDQLEAVEGAHDDDPGDEADAPGEAGGARQPRVDEHNDGSAAGRG